MSRSEIIQLQRSYGVADDCFRYSGIGGEIAAGSVGLDDVLVGFSVGAGRWLERLRITVTTIVAFTVPLTPGRALKLSALPQMPTGGNTGFLTTKSSGAVVDSGGMRIADTAPLGGTTAVNQRPIAIIPLIGSGNAGAVLEYELTFGLDAANCATPAFLGVSGLNAFDAGGTVQLVAELDYQAGP